MKKILIFLFVLFSISAHANYSPPMDCGATYKILIPDNIIFTYNGNSVYNKNNLADFFPAICIFTVTKKMSEEVSRA